MNITIPPDDQIEMDDLNFELGELLINYDQNVVCTELNRWLIYFAQEKKISKEDYLEMQSDFWDRQKEEDSK